MHDAETVYSRGTGWTLCVCKWHILKHAQVTRHITHKNREAVSHYCGKSDLAVYSPEWTIQPFICTPEYYLVMTFIGLHTRSAGLTVTSHSSSNRTSSYALWLTHTHTPHTGHTFTAQKHPSHAHRSLYCSRFMVYLFSPVDNTCMLSLCLLDCSSDSFMRFLSGLLKLQNISCWVHALTHSLANTCEAGGECLAFCTVYFYLSSELIFSSRKIKSLSSCMY